MPDTDDPPPYRVERDGAQFRIVTTDGSTALTCGDERSAEQYTVLMNEAWHRGYKAGFRKARRAV